MNNVFYFYNLNLCGGVETWLYNISKLYGDKYDINVFYNTGDAEQINRLRKYAHVYQYFPGTIIKCNTAFLCYGCEIIDNIEAKNYYYFIHTDYKKGNLRYTPNKKITKYYSVSELARKSFKEHTGIDSEVIYNPSIAPETKKVLKLISATRLTKEKGIDRMIQLAEELIKKNIPFKWDIYTNKKNTIELPGVEYHNVKLNLGNEIKEADYLVQLSDYEGYCYSMVEALMLGTPVIITDWPVLKELKIDNKYGFILDFDMENLNVKDIYSKKGAFKIDYTPPTSNIDKLLAKGKRNVKKDVKCVVKKPFRDIEDNIMRKKGDIMYVDEMRYVYLSKKRNLVK